MTAQKTSGIRNPSHPIPDDIAEMFRNMNDAEQANLTRQHKLAKLGRPTKEERLELTKIEGAVSNKRALNSDQLNTIRDLSKKRSDRILAELKTYADAEIGGQVHPYPPSPFPHSFWWASSNWWFPNWLTVDFDSQGSPHFKGYVSEFEGELRKESFGYASLFELQSWRIPDSPIGQWLSTPNIVVAGGLFGYTHLWESGIGEPNRCYCWIYRTQTIFQSASGFVPFGADLPSSATICAENKPPGDPLINEDRADRTMWVPFPGSQTMTSLITEPYSVNTNLSLWVRLSIYFDITVTNGTVSLNPEVFLRTPEWRLRALS